MLRVSLLRCDGARPVAAALVTAALLRLPGWRVDGNNRRAITCDYQFADFVQAMRFMNAVAVECEKAQHHPEWTNVYNRVHVLLRTHDAGNAVTQKDLDLAGAMNSIYSSMKANSGHSTATAAASSPASKIH